MTGRERIIEPPGCRLDAAAYLLGALEPAEAHAFVRHLEQCGACRDEMAALAPVIGDLAAAAPPRRVPAALRRRVLRAVREERKAVPISSRARPRRRRTRLPLIPGWVALPAAIAGAALVLFGGARDRAQVIRASVGHAELRVTNGQGELIVRRLPTLPPNRTYEVWLQSARQTSPSTLFAVASGGRADLRVPGDLHGVSRVMVTVEPRGGSLVPTTPAVIQVPLTYVRRS